jgi:hypothetical protein
MESRFNDAFLEGLLEGLLKEIKKKTPEELLELMKEDPAITERRRSLEEKIERLREIKEKLDAIYPPGQQVDKGVGQDDDGSDDLDPVDSVGDLNVPLPGPPLPGYANAKMGPSAPRPRSDYSDVSIMKPPEISDPSSEPWVVAESPAWMISVPVPEETYGMEKPESRPSSSGSFPRRAY